MSLHRSLSLAFVLFLAGLTVAVVAPAVLPSLLRLESGSGFSSLGRFAAYPPPSSTPTPTGTPTPVSTPTHTATVPPTSTLTPTPRPTNTPTPTPTRRVLSRAIFVDQDAQVMHIYENEVEIRTLPCSTGLPLPGKLTPAWVGRVGAYVGTFFAYDVYADDAWYLFDYDGGILIHSAPYTLVEGKKVYQETELLGKKPASHGCIRLWPEDARWLTQWNPLGVPITISPMTREF